MFASLLTALVLSPAALAEPPPGACTYDPAPDKPKVAFSQTTVTTTVVFADNQCDGLIGTDGCGTTEDTAFGGLTPHCPATVTTSFTPIDGGPDIEDTENNELIRQRSFFQTAAFSPSEEGGDRKLTVSVGTDISADLVLGDDAWTDGGWDEATTDTHTLAVRIVRDDDDSSSAYLEVKLQGLKKDAELWPYTTATVLSDVGLDDKGASGLPLGLSRYRGDAKSKGANATAQWLTDFTYDYSIATAAAEYKGTVTATDGDPEEGIFKSKLKRKGNGKLKHVVWTIDDEAGGANAVDVAVYDADGQDVLIVDGDTPTFSASTFETDTDQSFDGSPVGTPYNITLSASHEDGGSAGETFDIDFTFEEGSGTIDLSAWSLIEQGGLVYELDGTDLTWTLATSGGETTNIASRGAAVQRALRGPLPPGEPPDLRLRLRGPQVGADGGPDRRAG